MKTVSGSKGRFAKSFKGGSGSREGRGKDRESLGMGEYGRMSMECGRLSARQREAARRVRRQERRIGGESKIWRKVPPVVPVSKKPREVRMGKGKGSVAYWAVNVKPGKRRYEVRGVSSKLACVALTKAGKKRPVRTKRVGEKLR